MQRLVLVIGILALVVGVVFYVKSRPDLLRGPDRSKKNNLVEIACLPKIQGTSYPGHTDIRVDAQQGISVEYEAVFLCAGEKIRWVAEAGVSSFEVSFPSGNPNEWPFTDTFSSPIPVHGNHTDDQTVRAIDPKFRLQPFKYKIHVVTAGSPGTIDLDPHVMPM